MLSFSTLINDLSVMLYTDTQTVFSGKKTASMSQHRDAHTARGIEARARRHTTTMAYDSEGPIAPSSDYQYLEQSCGIAGHALSAALAVRPH